MPLGIYTIIFANFRPPTIMLGLRAGPDYNRPCVSENAERHFVCVVKINSANKAERPSV